MKAIIKNLETGKKIVVCAKRSTLWADFVWVDSKGNEYGLCDKGLKPGFAFLTPQKVVPHKRKQSTL